MNANEISRSFFVIRVNVEVAILAVEFWVRHNAYTTHNTLNVLSFGRSERKTQKCVVMRIMEMETSDSFKYTYRFLVVHIVSMKWTRNFSQRMFTEWTNASNVVSHRLINDG